MEAQIDNIIKKLRPILPLKAEKVVFALKIPAEYLYKVYGYIKSLRPKKEEYDSEGNYYCLLELPAGMAVDAIEKISKLTDGNALVKRMQKS